MLIVDDDEEVHFVTRLSLENYSYHNKPIEFFSCYSRVEAEMFLESNKGIAFVLLDVVMEENDAGLRLVRFIRETQKNSLLQIILRTGHPGQAPEEDVIKRYDINDYRLKTELTREKLLTVVTVALRTYAHLEEMLAMRNTLVEKSTQLESLNKHLEERIYERTIEISETNTQLQKAVSDKRNLIRILSHDLNNYCSIVMSFLNVAEKYISDLSEVEIAATLRDIWAKINRAAQLQIDLIKHVNEMEAVSSGKKLMVLQPVSVRKVYEEALFAFLERLLDKRLTVEYTAESEDLRVIADPILFSNSVFNNVLSNAIKFSQEGGTIYVEVALEGDDRVRLTVRDCGIGIPQAILTDIFRADKKTSRVGTKGERGTGFGMPLVKCYVEKFEGSVNVKSVEGRGTTVNIVLKKG